MDSYIRFQTSMRCPQTGIPLGIFRAAGYIEDASRLPEDVAERLRESLIWFNENLRVPRMRGRKTRGIFWFRSEAEEMLDHVSQIIAILLAEGLSVERQQTTTPGKIVYCDNEQVAAIPRKKLRHIKLHALRV